MIRPDISMLNGTILPLIDARELAGGRTRPLPECGLLVFVQPRCVASRRLMALLDELDPAKSEVPVTLAVAGEHPEAQRLVIASVGQAHLLQVLPSQLPAELREFIPCAVMLTPDWRVRHAGSMSDDTAVTRFIEACGDKRIRQWFNNLPIGLAP